MQSNSNDPVVVITDEMIEEGEFVLTAAGKDMDTGALAILVFVAMLSRMEDGRVVFSDGIDGLLSRYQRPTQQ